MEIQAEISLDFGHSHFLIPFKVSLDRLAIKGAVEQMAALICSIRGQICNIKVI
jgi:hypothetical protein